MKKILLFFLPFIFCIDLHALPEEGFEVKNPELGDEESRKPQSKEEMEQREKQLRAELKKSKSTYDQYKKEMADKKMKRKMFPREYQSKVEFIENYKSNEKSLASVEQQLKSYGDQLKKSMVKARGSAQEEFSFGDEALNSYLKQVDRYYTPLVQEVGGVKNFTVTAKLMDGADKTMNALEEKRAQAVGLTSSITLASDRIKDILRDPKTSDAEKKELKKADAELNKKREVAFEWREKVDQAVLKPELSKIELIKKYAIQTRSWFKQAADFFGEKMRAFSLKGKEKEFEALQKSFDGNVALVSDFSADAHRLLQRARATEEIHNLLESQGETTISAERRQKMLKSMISQITEMEQKLKGFDVTIFDTINAGRTGLLYDLRALDLSYAEGSEVLFEKNKKYFDMVLGGKNAYELLGLQKNVSAKTIDNVVLQKNSSEYQKSAINILKSKRMRPMYDAYQKDLAYLQNKGIDPDTLSVTAKSYLNESGALSKFEISAKEHKKMVKFQQEIFGMQSIGMNNITTFAMNDSLSQLGAVKDRLQKLSDNLDKTQKSVPDSLMGG